MFIQKGSLHLTCWRWTFLDAADDFTFTPGKNVHFIYMYLNQGHLCFGLYYFFFIVCQQMYKDKDGGHRSKDIGSEIFQTLARQDFPKAFKEAYCVPPWLPPCVCPSQTTRPAQGRALHQRDGDVEGLRAECLVSRTFRVSRKRCFVITLWWH